MAHCANLHAERRRILLKRTERIRGVLWRGDPGDYARPRVRGDCINGPRPCPYVGCRYHLFLFVRDSGNITFPFGQDIEALERMPATCALDVADEGEHSAVEVGRFCNTSSEMVRILMMQAWQRLGWTPPGGKRGRIQRACR